MRVVTIFIENNESKYLIQKRSKEHNGKYGITSGHVSENEKAEEGAIREIKEELGLKINPKELTPFFNTQIGKNTYNFYHLKKDINLNNLQLQTEEVEKVKWCTKKEIEELINENKFYETQIEALDIFKKYIDEE